MESKRGWGGGGGVEGQDFFFSSKSPAANFNFLVPTATWRGGGCVGRDRRESSLISRPDESST